MGLRNFTLGIIGVGNMGEALLGGVIRSELTPKNQIFLYLDWILKVFIIFLELSEVLS